MTTYRVKTGSGIALDSLTVLSPQPDPGQGVQTTRRSFGANGTATDQGRYIEFGWSAYTTAAAYQTLLGQFGLDSNTSMAPVTVYVRDETYAWIRMNGNAIRPIPGKQVHWGDRQSRPLDITILVRDLENSPASVSASDSVTIAETVTLASVPGQVLASESVTVSESADVGDVANPESSDAITVGESASASVVTP